MREICDQPVVSFLFGWITICKVFYFFRLNKSVTAAKDEHVVEKLVKFQYSSNSAALAIFILCERDDVDEGHTLLSENASIS